MRMFPQASVNLVTRSPSPYPSSQGADIGKIEEFKDQAPVFPKLSQFLQPPADYRHLDRTFL